MRGTGTVACVACPSGETATALDAAWIEALSEVGMFELCCTVRHCRQRLQRRDEGLFCAAGHHFDRAKQGYWNLLQPQDRRSSTPGDSDAAVLARSRWLARGFTKGLVRQLQPWVTTAQATAAQIDRPVGSARFRVLDLGCGEGSFGPALFTDHAEGYCGIDLSKRAIKLASRNWHAATWVLANADRFLPAAAHSVDCVLSLFGRRPISEIARVLTPGGLFIAAVPGQADLVELREQVQTVGSKRSRWARIVDEFTEQGFAFLEHKAWEQTVTLDPEAIADALAMTYRAVRHSQHAKAQELEEQPVTLAADLLLLRKHAG